ncbi:putative membrane protein [Burkholderia cenocepacia]|nr:putative membrane protein [Burkholderia cenocepacia]
MRLPPRIMLPVPHGGLRPADTGLSRLIWIAIVTMLAVLAVAKEAFLPRYFFFDAGTIDSFIAAGAPFVAGDSYSSTAAIFGAFGFRLDSPLLSLATCAIVVPTMLFGVTGAQVSFIKPRQVVLFVFCGVLAVVYMTTLSKDLIVMLIVLAFFARPRRHAWIGTLMWLGLALLYGYYFRTYWFLIVAIFVALRVMTLVTRRALLIVPAIFVLLFGIALILQIKLGVSADYYRVVINDARLEQGETHANTMIMPFIPGGTFVAGYLNTCSTFLTFIVPVPLLGLLSPYYVVIFTFVAVLQFSFWRAFLFEMKIGRDAQVIECACLVAAVLAIQSMFEPDYGSYVRHLAPFYPLMFLTWLRGSVHRASMASSTDGRAGARNPFVAELVEKAS